MLREIPGALLTELYSLDWRGTRGLEAAEAAASVTLAVLVALALHADDPWWAGISAFVVSKAAFSEAVSRGIMRVAGSVVGAITALVVLRLFVYQSLPFCLSLFVLAFIGMFGFACSRFGYAWVVGTVTACLVMLVSLGQPASAFNTAVDRVAEVAIGTIASLIVCGLSRAAAAGVLAPSLRRGAGALASRQAAVDNACLPRRADGHADAGAGRLAGAAEPGHDGYHGGHDHADSD